MALMKNLAIFAARNCLIAGARMVGFSNIYATLCNIFCEFQYLNLSCFCAAGFSIPMEESKLINTSPANIHSSALTKMDVKVSVRS